MEIGFDEGKVYLRKKLVKNQPQVRNISRWGFASVSSWPSPCLRIRQAL